MRYKKTIIVSSLVLLVVLTFSFFFFQPQLNPLGCTLMGCFDGMTFAINQSINGEFEVEFNGLFIDSCLREEYREQLQENPSSDLRTKTEMSTIWPNHEDTTHFRLNNLYEEVTFKLYVKESCDAEATLIAEIIDYKPTYKEHRPNGPFCEPICQTTIIYVS